jgi:hypothetical protein
MIWRPISCLRDDRKWVSSPFPFTSHGDDSPRLPRDLAPIVHVLLGLGEGVEVEHALVCVVLAGPDLRVLTRVLVGVLHLGIEDDVGAIIDEDVTWCVPSVVGEGSEMSESAGERERRTNRPKQRSNPPMKPIVSSTTHIFSCCKVEIRHFDVWRTLRAQRETHMRPKKRAGGGVRRRTLHMDVGVQTAEASLSVVRVNGAVRMKKGAVSNQLRSR